MIRKRVSFSIGIVFLAILVSYGTLVVLVRNKVFVDGQVYTNYSLTKTTVQELLTEYQIRVNPQDLVRPDLTEKLRWGQNVEIIRVTETLENKEEIVGFVLDWKRKTGQNLRMVEIQHGHRLTTTWQERRIFHDGRQVSSAQLQKKVNKTPVDRLVLLSRRGAEEKIYDLSALKKKTLVATAYWIGDPLVPGDTTFSGHRVQRGLVAVDPKVIPLGYRLYIPGYGYAYSSDTGSAIKGKRIDLFVESAKASRSWEYRKVPVYLLEKAKTW